MQQYYHCYFWLVCVGHLFVRDINPSTVADKKKRSLNQQNMGKMVSVVHPTDGGVSASGGRRRECSLAVHDNRPRSDTITK